MNNFLGISFAEWVGYLASFVVLVSFLMTKMRTLRIVNMTGGMLFVVYGFLLNISWPIVITNLAIVAINFFHLLKKKENQFS